MRRNREEETTSQKPQTPSRVTCNRAFGFLQQGIRFFATGVPVLGLAMMPQQCGPVSIFRVSILVFKQNHLRSSE
jgi:hypothetical protein